MSTVEDRFQAMLAKRKKEKKEENSEVVVKNKNSIAITDVFEVDSSIFGDLTDDRELVEFLEKKSVEMLSIQSKNMILLGKNLTEVFNELGRKGSPEGLYVKYIEFNGYKKDTALRLRKRYELFEATKNERIKQIISILPVRAIEQFYKEKEDIFVILDEENNDVDYKRVMDIIKSRKTQNLEYRNTEEINYDFEIGQLDDLYKKINNKFDELDKKKKEKIAKLLLEIEKILS
ncbi:hypothetical protein IX317_000735 [Fusobacterium sp. DD29]|uniref:hypothetical protein n=1 Tax=unclassified Fusobacterium TaxID=2648384 RepID=UPI001B8BC773|nr:MULTISPECIES: hypothetical protein [unclassified Fusobacterium]MBR8701055.1 hypothetical protein [Fusobacterium sp. DD45]MBR8710861.1 hypothetical protein [Fusobacterium sp. DD28]MBR8749073.1 hypothetical protein [Fusobacterium sp. DD29]MBR8751463.1 hypothetical protein [Fusobacterium sp. DD26]MBR8761339.1 hypothetical protein [Fusobacterium sp. DD25]